MTKIRPSTTDHDHQRSGDGIPRVVRERNRFFSTCELRSGAQVIRLVSS